MAVVVLVALGLAFLLSKPMSAYQLGEAYAQKYGREYQVGSGVELILLSSVLSACVTAFAGPISFVGIAVPQLMKQSSENGETDSGDSGLFPGRSSVLPVL